MIQKNISFRESIIWQIESGIDECIGDIPIDRFIKITNEVIDSNLNQVDQKITGNYNASSNQTKNSITDASSILESITTEPSRAPPPNHNSELDRAIIEATAMAGTANSIPDLRNVIENFEGCALKKTAMNTVFSDGNPSAKIMFIGTVPGADEDRNGVPFSGLSGRLFDKILASINLDRSSCYLTNIIFWRPPGDREPTLNEVAVCIPFVERQIELILPDLIVLLGGPASKALLGTKKGISKIHGQYFEYTNLKIASPIVAVPLYHPINLLSSPAYKQDAWRDLLKIKERLSQKL